MPNVWPATLPQKQFGPIKDRTEANAIVFQTGEGPQKMRPRSTRPRRFQSFYLLLTGTQLDTFKDFFDNTLAYGTLPFEWEDAVTDETVTFRFASAKPPEWSTWLDAPEPSDRLYDATIELEAL